MYVLLLTGISVVIPVGIIFKIVPTEQMLNVNTHFVKYFISSRTT